MASDSETSVYAASAASATATGHLIMNGQNNLLGKADLEALRFPVPRDYSETHDAIASLISYAPDYKNKFFPKYTIEVGYSRAIHGLDAVERLLASPEQQEIAARCKAELLGAYEAFKQGDEDRGLRLIQAADQTFLSLKKGKGRQKQAL